MRNKLKFILVLWLVVIASVSHSVENKQLVFFFASECPYCHKMAPVILKVAKKYNLPVIGSSLDGKGISGFDKPLCDLKLARAFKIRSLPTIGGVDENKKEVGILIAGLHDETNIENTIINWLEGE